MGLRTWLSIVTAVLLALVVFFAWDEIMAAFGEFGNVNLWILSLLIPVQFLSYFSTGEMLFSYLRSKGEVKHLSRLGAARMALEFNFVNHVFPSGGASGVTYMAWLLRKHGVRPGRSTMAQIVRFSMTFLSFIFLLVVALAILIIDHSVTRHALLISLALVAAAIAATLMAIYLVSSKRRLTSFAGWLTRLVNTIVARLTRGQKEYVLREGILLDFFDDIHDDYLQIRRERKVLARPFGWAIMANLLDVTLLFIAFAALGTPVNPAMLFLAFGLSSVGAALAITPGGAGVYEAIMIAFLASAGVPPHVAIAGTLLARVALLVLTIGFGYIFYQLSVVKYGKSPIKR